MRFRALIVAVIGSLVLSAASLSLADNMPPLPPPPDTIKPPQAQAHGEKLLPTGHRHVIINQMNVIKLNGTIMADHADGTDPTALQTGSIVEKGDILTVYGDSWVILKTNRGDQIGLSGNTIVTIDECYMEGPDRQIRLLVKRGNVLLRTNGDNSRQSFFEINLGNVVVSVNDVQAILSFDPSKNFLDVKYIDGKIRVIDQDHEENFTEEQSEYNGYTKSVINEQNNQGIPEEHTEHTWINGKMAEEAPIPLEELDEINFKKFFDGEKPLEAQDDNILLDDSSRVPYRQR